MAESTWEKIDSRVAALKDLNTRQDLTAHYLHWDDNPYGLVKPDGKTKLDDAISVTPNLPKVFARSVISDLLSGSWQIRVEGQVSKRQAHVVESFIEDNFAQADEMLQEEEGIPSLHNWLCNHVCVRWSIGVMWISQLVRKGKEYEYKIHCKPVDMRWTPFIRNKWVAPIFKLDKESLEEELEGYERKAKEGGGEYRKFRLGAGELYEVRDYWSNETNELWVDKKLVFTQKNYLGYPPFVIVTPATGFMLRDEGYLRHEGEDILFLNSGLYNELARSISLEQTSGYAGLYPPYEYETANMDGKPSRPAPKIDESQKVPEGELHKPVPRGDLNRAGQTARVDIQEMISAGGPLSPRQYNTPPSAILLAGETELISRLYNAPKDALGIMKSRLAKMMVKQLRAIDKGNVDIVVGGEGMKSSYSSLKLGDPDKYKITYHLSVKSKRQELANLAEFAAVYDKLPLEWTLENILMADDPAGIINSLELQKAKNIAPALSLIDMAVRYAREAKDIEDDDEAELKIDQSKILLHEYTMAMRARIQPTPSPVGRVEPPKGSTHLLTQLGGAAGAMRGETGRVRPQEEAIV